MSEDAPGNPGAVAWPDDFTASVMVRRMQVKLHRWAAGDPARPFGDLFNFVYDPALPRPDSALSLNRRKDQTLAFQPLKRYV